MKTYRVLGQKGRTTIPLSIRIRLGLRCGDVLSFAEENGTVIVRKEKICDLCKGKESCRSIRTRILFLLLRNS